MISSYGDFFYTYIHIMNYESYILAFWPHPDDIEAGAGGALITSARAGKRNIAIDLTPSQMSTRWTVETRLQESQDAALLLWLSERKNMHMEDGCIYDTCAYRKKIAHEIRLYKPEIVLIPWSYYTIWYSILLSLILSYR